MQRYVEIGEWIYEIKLVKAIKVPKFGEPYTAICHFNFIDDEVTIESMLSVDPTPLSNTDMQTHSLFLKELNVSQVHFVRYSNGQKRKVTREL